MQNYQNWSEYFLYDESIPNGLRWRIDVYSGKDYKSLVINSGSPAGSLGKRRYFSVKLFGILYKNHRIIYEMHHGRIESNGIIDHKDGNSSNNNIENLRLVNTKINGRNLKKTKANTSGFTGVSFSKINNCWRAAWNDHRTGKSYKKSFTCIKHGYEKAYELACKFRNRIIKEMNADGAGYTERHGK